MNKERFDVFLVKNGYFNSREKARTSILAGVVYVNGEKENKPSYQISEDAQIEIKENVHPYVSRGGLKLEKALKVFNLNLNNRVCIDIGASTGGFTDCMLKNGASFVYAVDVGSNQLAEELKYDNRILSLENKDIRDINKNDLDKEISFCSIDVSFISLKKVLPHVKILLNSPYEIICLVKPQFEAGKGKIGKKGVVKDKKVHFEVLLSILVFCINEGLNIKGVSFSPIKGPEGNIEYLLYLSSNESLINLEECSNIVKKIVEDAFTSL